MVPLWIALAAAAVVLSSVVAVAAIVATGIAHTAMTPPALRFDEQDPVGVIGALFSDH